MLTKERLEEFARYRLKNPTANGWYHSPDKASVSFQMSEVVEMASRLLELERKLVERAIEFIKKAHYFDDYHNRERQSLIAELEALLGGKEKDGKD